MYKMRKTRKSECTCRQIPRRGQDAASKTLCVRYTYYCPSRRRENKRRCTILHFFFFCSHPFFFFFFCRSTLLYITGLVLFIRHFSLFSCAFIVQALCMTRKKKKGSNLPVYFFFFSFPALFFTPRVCRQQDIVLGLCVRLSLCGYTTSDILNVSANKHSIVYRKCTVMQTVGTKNIKISR